MQPQGMPHRFKGAKRVLSVPGTAGVLNTVVFSAPPLLISETVGHRDQRAPYCFAPKVQSSKEHVGR